MHTVACLTALAVTLFLIPWVLGPTGDTTPANLKKLDADLLTRILRSRGQPVWDETPTNDLLANRVRMTGQVSLGELAAISNRNSLGQPIEFQCESAFFDFISGDWNSLWLLRVVPFRDKIDKSRNNDWIESTAILEHAGIRAAVIYCCKSDDSVCYKNYIEFEDRAPHKNGGQLLWKLFSLRQHQSVVDTKETINFSINLIGFWNGQSAKQTVTSIADRLRKQHVKRIVTSEQLRHFCSDFSSSETLDDPDTTNQVHVLYLTTTYDDVTSRPPDWSDNHDYVPPFISAIAAEFWQRGVVFAAVSEPSLIDEALECYGFNSSTLAVGWRYIVSTPEASYVYGSGIGEHINYESLTFFLRTVQPDRVDILRTVLGLINLFLVIDLILYSRWVLIVPCNLMFMVIWWMVFCASDENVYFRYVRLQIESVIRWVSLTNAASYVRYTIAYWSVRPVQIVLFTTATLFAYLMTLRRFRPKQIDETSSHSPEVTNVRSPADAVQRRTHRLLRLRNASDVAGSVRRLEADGRPASVRIRRRQVSPTTLNFVNDDGLEQSVTIRTHHNPPSGGRPTVTVDTIDAHLTAELERVSRLSHNLRREISRQRQLWPRLVVTPHGIVDINHSDTSSELEQFSDFLRRYIVQSREIRDRLFAPPFVADCLSPEVISRFPIWIWPHHHGDCPLSGVLTPESGIGSDNICRCAVVAQESLCSQLGDEEHLQSSENGYLRTESDPLMAGNDLTIVETDIPMTNNRFSTTTSSNVTTENGPQLPGSVATFGRIDHQIEENDLMAGRVLAVPDVVLATTVSNPLSDNLVIDNSGEMITRSHISSSSTKKEIGTPSYPPSDNPWTVSEECAICSSHYCLNDRLCTLPCGHTFHKRGIVVWFSSHTCCPTCRGPCQ